MPATSSKTPRKLWTARMPRVSAAIPPSAREAPAGLPEQIEAREPPTRRVRVDATRVKRRFSGAAGVLDPGRGGLVAPVRQ
jgi:hypothetical protein